MWVISEIEKLKKCHNDDTKLEDFLNEDQIRAIRGEFVNNRFENNIRYLNLRNLVFVGAKHVGKVKLIIFFLVN